MTTDGPELFVARERELERLDSFLGLAHDGKCSICLVAGEAGAGKTTLVNEFARRAQQRDEELLVAFGDCNAQTGFGDPYLPFREALAVLLGDFGAYREQGRMTNENAGRIERFMRVSAEALVENGPDLVGLFVPGGSILTRLGAQAASRLPWAGRLRELQERSAPGVGAAQQGIEQGHIFEQYTNVLRAVAAKRRLMLVLDDLQWGDAGSIGLLFHLARRLGAAPILIVGTYRPEDVALGRRGEQHPLESTLQELKRYFGDIVIELGRSDQDDARELIDALVDAVPNRLPDGFRDALVQHTGGNPLFASELLQHLRERGELRCEPDGCWIATPQLEWTRLPPRVEGVIDNRIGRLDAELRDMLQVAAVEGENFTAEVLARVRKADERGTVQRLSAELERQHRLVGARDLVRRGAQRLSRYRFRHNLFQKYVYVSLDAAQRAYLHEDVGRVLEALYGDDADEVAPQLARHFEEAGVPAAALRYRFKAGERARRLYANAEALQHYDAACELLRTAAPADLEAGEKERLAVQLEEARGDVLEFTGRHAEAETAYRRALAEPSATPVQRARLLSRLAMALHGQRRNDEAAEALDAADRELGGVPDGTADDMTAAWIENQHNGLWIHYWRGDTERMTAIVEAAAPVVEASGTPLQRSRFHHLQVLKCYRRDGFVATPETRDALLAARDALRGVDDNHAHGMLQFGLGFDQLWAGEADAATRTLSEALSSARRSGDRVLALRALTYSAVAARMRGDVEATRELTATCRQHALEIDMPEYTATADANDAWIAWCEGRPGDVRILAHAALAAWDEHAAALPLRWLALWPLTAATLHDDDIGEALACAHGMLHPRQQRLPELLTSRLREAVAAEALDQQRAALERAVRAAAGWPVYLPAFSLSAPGAVDQ